MTTISEGGQALRRSCPTLLLGLLALVALAGCTEPERPAGKTLPTEGPRLILLISVDQLRGDYLDDYDPLFTGGLRRLADEGVIFTDAHHQHAVTTTAVGHATLATGRFPRHHGIINNYWIDPESGDEIYAVDDDEFEYSPRNLLASTLGDWLKGASPASKVFGASAKNRAAILSVGHAADAALWYEDDGTWVTSDYYSHGEPPWLAALNDERWMDRYFGTAWEPLPVAPEVLVALDVESTDLGPLEEDFPHTFGGMSLAPGESFYDAVWTSPWLDLYLAELAERLIVGEDLGGDDHPDLLALSFSALDSVGHTYGPGSREVLDILLRLDLALGKLFTLLDERVGRDRVLIAATADHGSVGLPERRQARGLPGRRATAVDQLCLQRVEGELRSSLGGGPWLVPGPFLDRATLEASGRDHIEVEGEVARLLEACEAVERVWTRSQLVDPDGPLDLEHELFANAFAPARSPDFLIRYQEWFMPYSWVPTTHGSSYAYDTHVPLLIHGPGTDPARIAERVRTVDVAPTLAAMAGIPLPTGLDGRDLRPLTAAAGD